MTPDSDPIGLSPFSSPVSARNAVDRLAEETWSNHEKLGMIEGQVGGSPPMDDAELRAAGFAEMTNLNFRGSKMACVRAASKLVDLFASYKFNRQLTARVNVNNAFNKEYYLATYTSGKFTYMGDARNVRATLNYDF